VAGQATSSGTDYVRAGAVSTDRSVLIGLQLLMTQAVGSHVAHSGWFVVPSEHPINNTPVSRFLSFKF
jgi:hypothetical protein